MPMASVCFVQRRAPILELQNAEGANCQCLFCAEVGTNFRTVQKLKCGALPVFVLCRGGHQLRRGALPLFVLCRDGHQFWNRKLQRDHCQCLFCAERGGHQFWNSKMQTAQGQFFCSVQRWAPILELCKI